MMKIAGIIVSILLIIWVGASIAFMWGNELIKVNTYIKLTITLGILAVAVGIIAMIFNEYFKEKKYKDEKFLD